MILDTLIIDDSIIQVQKLRSILDVLQIKSYCAFDVTDVNEIIDLFDFPIVIINDSINEIPWQDLLAIVYKKINNCITILLSDNVSKTSINFYIENGVDFIIEKPFQINEIRTIFNKIKEIK